MVRLRVQVMGMQTNCASLHRSKANKSSICFCICYKDSFEILGMHFTNELCNNCANHTILCNYITQKLRNIRRHYANNTQSLRNIRRYYANITQTLRRHYENTLRKIHKDYADITQMFLRNCFYAKITQKLRK